MWKRWSVVSPRLRGVFDLERKRDKVRQCASSMEQPHFWDDQEEAKKCIEQLNALKVWVEPCNEVEDRLRDMDGLMRELKESEGQLTQQEYEDWSSELYSEYGQLCQLVDELEKKRMLSGEYDASPCFLTISAGAGGTESCDWVLMLSRMYQRWAQTRRWKVQCVDSLDGDSAGLRRVTFRIEGPLVYGYVKAERGVHRLVRISPFDSNARRHTSFASVDVSPEVSDDVEIDLNKADLKIDTFRASGAGGQHVNTTDSAVRITHIPTGIICSCQNERSQQQNREMCLKMVRAKLHQFKQEQREKEIDALGGEKKEIAWGSQIRSYVLHPYRMVKDHRTNWETGNVDAFLNGEIDEAVEAFLLHEGG